MQKPSCFGRTSVKTLKSCHRFFFSTLLRHVNPFWIQLGYFITLSSLGYLALKATATTTSSAVNALDMFFTSVSSATVSSMSTVEMESFSNTQLIIITILMLAGGEVFTSFLDLQFKPPKPSPAAHQKQDVESIEAGGDQDHEHEHEHGLLEQNSMKYLGFVVLSYLIVIHTVGSCLISMYVSLSPTAKEVLATKSIQLHTFSVFTTVSTFSNCGFLPTNENMIVFIKNSGLQLILIPQVLLGNTLYPPALRFLIWVLERFTKKAEFRYILKNSKDLGYDHLLPTALHSLLLVATVFGFILLQFVMFCSLEWNSEAMDGLSSYQKMVSAFFQVANSRHAGESVFDLSVISPPILVLFIVMMYLPPYTSFLPIKKNKQVSQEKLLEKEEEGGRKPLMQWWLQLFSPLSYLVMFIILICIIEREQMMTDPLNFNVLNISLEVVSAYGNVGFSTGYSCKRQLKAGGMKCSDAWYGFVGRWSTKAKLILVIVMFFGRLKKFFIGGGKPWKLS